MSAVNGNRRWNFFYRVWDMQSVLAMCGAFHTYAIVMVVVCWRMKRKCFCNKQIIFILFCVWLNRCIFGAIFDNVVPMRHPIILSRIMSGTIFQHSLSDHIQIIAAIQRWYILFMIYYVFPKNHFYLKHKSSIIILSIITRTMSLLFCSIQCMCVTNSHEPALPLSLQTHN